MENRYTPDNFTTMRDSFLTAYPAYADTSLLDELRQTDYSRLDLNQQVYLDYTGSGLYAQRQLDDHFEMLANGVWGNPHSENPTSLAMTARVEQARADVLAYFNADPAAYDVIFTPNASGALKLLGESFPFGEGSHFVALADNHNSVNGIREFARAKGATVTYVPTVPPAMRLDEGALRAALADIDTGAANLFAYPAQSNFSGVQHDLAWIAVARERGWTTLLDAAAFVPTNTLDLSVHQPDFVSLSFYKMFGYPTGIGCLIARNEALAQMQRPWFAGGTIKIVSIQSADWHYMGEGHAAFEEGTVNFLSIPAVAMGLKHIESIGIERIHERVNCLTGWLLSELTALQHRSGAPLVQVHGPLTTAQRGATIAFNLNDPAGERLDYRRIEKLANEANISLRTGCFCNPGSGEIAHNLTREDMAQAFSFEVGPSFEELYDMAAEHFDKYPSAIRVSLGVASNFADVYALLAFLEQFRDQAAAAINTLPVERARHARDTA